MKMKTLSLFAATLVGGAILCQQAQAVPITGSVDMSGTAILDSMFLGTAGAATSFSAVTVGGIPTGAFVGTAGTSATWNSFGWSPSTTPVTPLWSFVVGPWTYSFDLTTVAVFFQNNSFLNLTGTGTLNILGAGSPYTATSGDWSFTISNPGGGSHQNFAFTFANSQTAALPEGGLTIAFLGSALLGLGMLRRRLS